MDFHKWKRLSKTPFMNHSLILLRCNTHHFSRNWPTSAVTRSDFASVASFLLDNKIGLRFCGALSPGRFIVQFHPSQRRNFLNTELKKLFWKRELRSVLLILLLSGNPHFRLLTTMLQFESIFFSATGIVQDLVIIRQSLLLNSVPRITT